MPEAAWHDRALRLLQARTDGGMFERVASGEGPFPSAVLGAYLISADEGRLLRISEDEQGQHPWPTAEEAERAEKERALARLAELQAELQERDAK